MASGREWPAAVRSGVGRWLALYGADLGVESAYLCRLHRGTITWCIDQTGDMVGLPSVLGPLAERIQERSSLVIVDDLSTDSVAVEASHQTLHGAFLGVGVLNESGALAAILLAYSRTPRQWTNRNLERAGDVAHGMASLVILHEYRTHAETRIGVEVRARELRQQMHKISAQAASAASLPELSRILAKQIPELLGADWAVVGVRDPESDWQVFVPPDRVDEFEAVFDGAAGAGYDLLDYAVGLESETKEVTSVGVTEWPAFRHALGADDSLRMFATALSTTTELSMALLTGSNNSAVDLLTAYAFEELIEDARQAVERTAAAQRQIQAAATLQRSLLPPRLPDLPGFEVGRLYHSAADHTRVGGDWFDVVEIDAATTGFVVGDVAGHDIRSAAIMGQLRHVLASQLRDRRRPAGALTATDRYFADLAENVMATAVVMVIDRSTQRLHISLAGHPPPVLIADGHASLLQARPGPPIGLGYGGYQDMTRSVAANEVLVAYTDGVVETRDHDLSVALQHFVDELQAAATTSVPALIDLLDQRSAKSELVDDVAALVVRIEPEEP